ncbi:hypothetical protein ADIWIN_1370 [Winogradskyella psychrotolerans RS-3]|uniref:Outer membrane protein beta-barrel domain-containing protein n=2 Tax=Winogradskyella TaxID=286104 RepID=S7XCL7_9FLAO|nr:hypothetical protein ADIWIN_1370 [Winogradskyella psychrotolerans RS-3]
MTFSLKHQICLITFLSMYLMSMTPCFGQQSSQFATFQEDLASQNWDLVVNGIFLTKTVSFTASQFEFLNAEASLIEVPLLFKVKISEKLSLLSGAKIDFYKVQQRLSSDVGVSISTGLQYDINKNAFINAGFNYQINNTGYGYNYNYGNNSSFILKSGLKF